MMGAMHIAKSWPWSATPWGSIGWSTVTGTW